jgi:hypothetical protein
LTQLPLQQRCAKFETLAHCYFKLSRARAWLKQVGIALDGIVANAQ